VCVRLIVYASGALTWRLPRTHLVRGTTESKKYRFCFSRTNSKGGKSSSATKMNKALYGNRRFSSVLTRSCNRLYVKSDIPHINIYSAPLNPVSNSINFCIYAYGTYKASYHQFYPFKSRIPSFLFTCSDMPLSSYPPNCYSILYKIIVGKASIILLSPLLYLSSEA